MKKRTTAGVILLIITLILTLLLTACGSTGSTTTPSDGVNAGNGNTETQQSKGTPGTQETPETQKTQEKSESPETIETLKVGLSAGLMKPVGIIAADKLGYFTQEGVNVILEKVSSQPDATTAVSSGSMDIFPFGVVAPATYVSQGADMVIFGGTVAEGSEILAAESFTGTIETAEDFRGRVVSVSRAETGQMVLKDYLSQQGLDLESDVTFIYVDDQTVGMQGVKNGEFDFYICNNAMGYIGNRSGMKVVGTVRQFVPDYPCCRQFCSRNAYDNKFDALVKFEIAQLRGFEYYLTEKELTIEMLAEYSGQDSDYVEASMYGLDNYENVMDITLDPNKNAVIPFYETLKFLGEIDADTQYKIEDYIETDVYETALLELLQREPANELWTRLLTEFHENND